jgi:hypothetical protein
VTGSSLLAALVRTPDMQPEPVATDALVLLLQRSEVARLSLEGLVSAAGQLTLQRLTFTGQGTDAAQATSVCRFGASSGNGCSAVYQINVCNTYSSGDSYCGLIRTHRYTGSRDGDSGGPWYYGNNAYGVHSGSGWYYGIKRNFFTSTYYGLPDAGLTIKLAPR